MKTSPIRSALMAIVIGLAYWRGYEAGTRDARGRVIDVTTRVVPLTSTSSCSTTNFCTDGVESWPARVGGGGWMCVSNDAPRLR